MINLVTTVGSNLDHINKVKDWLETEGFAVAVNGFSNYQLIETSHYLIFPPGEVKAARYRQARSPSSRKDIHNKVRSDMNIYNNVQEIKLKGMNSATKHVVFEIEEGIRYGSVRLTNEDNILFAYLDPNGDKIEIATKDDEVLEFKAVKPKKEIGDNSDLLAILL